MSHPPTGAQCLRSFLAAVRRSRAMHLKLDHPKKPKTPHPFDKSLKDLRTVPHHGFSSSNSRVCRNHRGRPSPSTMSFAGIFKRFGRLLRPLSPMPAGIDREGLLLVVATCFHGTKRSHRGQHPGNQPPSQALAKKCGFVRCRFFSRGWRKSAALERP